MSLQRFLPNSRLMARGFHRVAPLQSSTAATTITANPLILTKNTRTSFETQVNAARAAAATFSTTASPRKWEGRQPEEHAANEPDNANVQYEEVKKGRSDRASSVGEAGEGESAATSEKGHGGKEKAEKEHPKAPGPVIGMEDERGGKGH